MTETEIAKPGIFDKLTPGGKKKIEAFRQQEQRKAFAAAEQRFVNLLTPFMEQVKALLVNVETKLVEDNKHYTSHMGTSANTRRFVTAERLDESKFRVVSDLADSVYEAGTLHRGEYASSPHYRTGTGYDVKREVVDVELINKQGKLAVSAVKLGSRNASGVEDLKWDDERLVVKPVAVRDTAGEIKALDLAALNFAALKLEGHV